MSGVAGAKRGRGRPSKLSELDALFRLLSPEYQARLKDAAGVNADILGDAQDLARRRADNLNYGRKFGAARETKQMVTRRERIKALAALLKEPAHAAWPSKSDSSIAGWVAARFPAVRPGTLRKDIAEAKKLARDT